MNDGLGRVVRAERRRRRHPADDRRRPRRCGSSSTTTRSGSASRSTSLRRATPPTTTRSSPPPCDSRAATEQFYFVMTDRFANGDTSNDTGGLTGDRLDDGLRPDRQGLLQRRRHRRPALQARLHRGSRHERDLADAELQEPPVQGDGRERERRLPRLLDHRLHADRPAPRHERRARGAHRRRARPRHQGLLRHHHEPHGRRHLVRRGASTPTSTRRPAPTTMPTATRSTPPTTPAPTRSPRSTRDELPVHARSSPTRMRTSRCRRGSTTRRCTTTAATRPSRASRRPTATSSASTT